MVIMKCISTDLLVRLELCAYGGMLMLVVKISVLSQLPVIKDGLPLLVSKICNLDFISEAHPDNNITNLSDTEIAFRQTE